MTEDERILFLCDPSPETDRTISYFRSVLPEESCVETISPEQFDPSEIRSRPPLVLIHEPALDSGLKASLPVSTMDYRELNPAPAHWNEYEEPKNSPVMELYFGMVGGSRIQKELRKTIEKVARSHATCLVSGESGTGKELVARAIHMESDRASGPFIPVNSGAIPAELIESELFGYTRGSFTGANQSRPGLVELADGGTLFLDEITETPVNFQTKLLRFLQEKTTRRIGSDRQKPVDVRIIAATNRNPQELIQTGQFREDLYYRLNVIDIGLNPLRRRKIDIPLLLRHFLDFFSRTENRNTLSISPKALTELLLYEWPGNVRELRNMVHRMVLLAEGNVIRETDLPAEVRNVSEMNSESSPVIQILHPEEEPGKTLKERERDAIREALINSHGNKDRAARTLGIGRATIYRKIKEFNIQFP